MPPKTGPVALVEHHVHQDMHHRKSVLKDEVDDLVSMHLNTNLKKNYVSERTLSLDQAEVEVPEEDELNPDFEDYEAFNKEQEGHAKGPLGVANMGLDILLDFKAKDELKRRASVAIVAKNPTKAAGYDLKKLPKFYQAVYSHQTTEIDVLDYNKDGTFYITKEVYDNGHGGHGKYAHEPFVLFTVRDSVKQRLQATFCLAPKGPSHTPDIKCGTTIEAPWWETRGAGDSEVNAVSGNAELIKVVKRGEAATKTGRLCVRMPGEHVLAFYDRKNCSSFVRSTDPLYFN
jgi:hypothetical protein